MARKEKDLLEQVKKAPDLVVRSRMGEPDAQGRRKVAYRDYSSKSLGIEVTEKLLSDAAKRAPMKDESSSKGEEKA